MLNIVTPRRMILANLPLQNLSNDPSQEYFNNGLTEETITILANSARSNWVS